MFHQPTNTFGNRIYNAAVYGKTEWGLHFHKSYELIYCMGEGIRVGVEGEDFFLSKGEFLLIFPYKKHEFTVQNEREKVWVGVFSEDHIKEFDKEFSQKEVDGVCFFANEATEKFLQERLLIDRAPDRYTLKGCLYLLMGQIQEKVRNCKAKKKDEKDLIMKIISYVEENFREDITLYTLAESLGYHYQYLSRVIQKNMRLGFRTLVNQYRFDYARFLLESEGVTVTQAALDAGFQSVRNFNRVYKEKTGVSPHRGNVNGV